MGCLNSEGQFSHWFGNIHLSGPCNRACYFCIGQHMMALDQFNNLNTWPLVGLNEFVEACAARGVGEVNLTGSNTDPLLYRHHKQLTAHLRSEFPNVALGIRTNGVRACESTRQWALYDKHSVSITSFNPETYAATMGVGMPPDIRAIRALTPERPLKVNIVLCREIGLADLAATLTRCADAGVNAVNLREPYGQPHIGDPFVSISDSLRDAGKRFTCASTGRASMPKGWNGRDCPCPGCQAQAVVFGVADAGILKPIGQRYGMPVYEWRGMEVMYWDVHYVEVESVNLYASGRVSLTYPVTKGCAEDGLVQGQERFLTSGRVRAQWLGAVG